MKPLVKNRYLDALIKTILAYALIHTVMMIVKTVETGKPDILNGFSILGISLFLPKMSEGWVNFFLSYIPMGAIYLIVYIKLTDKP